MGRWVFAIALVGAGALLSLLGIGQLGAALTQPAGAASGHVVRVFSESGSRPSYAFELAGRSFRLAALSLPHPSADALKAAQKVTVDYGANGVIMGLDVDGRPYFTPWDYRLLIGVSALIALLPGLIMLGFAVDMFGRKTSAPRAPSPRRPRKAYVLPEDTMAVVLPFRRKTPEGEWVH